VPARGAAPGEPSSQVTRWREPSISSQEGLAAGSARTRMWPYQAPLMRQCNQMPTLPQRWGWRLAPAESDDSQVEHGVGDWGARAKSRTLVELAVLCDAHCGRALGFAYALLADRDLAEHAVEEALLTAWRAGAAGAVGTEATDLLLRGLVVHQATLRYCQSCSTANGFGSLGERYRPCL
jgi:hypothetical protein